MKRVIGSSLRVKIMGSVAATVLLLGAATMAFVGGMLSNTLKEELSQRGVMIARDLAARSVDLVLTYDDLDLHALVHSTRDTSHDVRYAFITDAKGRLLVHTFEEGFPYDLLPATSLTHGREYQTHLLLTEEGPLLDVAVPIYGGSGVAHVGMSYRQIDLAVASATRWLLVVTGVVMALGLIAAYWLSGLIVRPLRELMAAARDVGRGNLSRRASILPTDEIGQLGAVFNSMAGDLERSRNELLALQEAVAAVSISLSLEAVLQTILRAVTQGLAYERATLALVDESGGRIKGALSIGHEATLGLIDYSISQDSNITAYVCRTGEPIIVPDAQHDQRIPLEVRRNLDLKQIAVVPIKSGSRVLGVIGVDRPIEGEITEQRLHSLSVFASQAAVAIENARLFEQATERARQLATLNAVATVINELRDPDEMLGQALDRILEMLKLEAGGVLLWNEAIEGLEYRASKGFPERLIQGVGGLKRGEGIAGRVFASGEPISLEDISEDARLTKSVVREEGFRCFASVPVRCKGKILGVLNVASRARRSLPSRDIGLLVAIGQQLGVALENVRLVGEASKIEALRELDRLKSEFVARASHELRTPVTSIRGYVETLLREDMDLNQITQRELFEDMDQVTDRLSRLVHDLLNVSRIDVGMLEMRKDVVQLDLALERTVRRFKVQGDAHTFKVLASHDLPPALADPDRLDDVLDNLLSNAVKYSPRGGTITARARIREAGDHAAQTLQCHSSESVDAAIVISVSDQGVGIPTGELAKLFRRFYQADDGPVARRWGIGLGLYLCKTYVEAMGGEIWAESEVGKSSSFSFTLPIANTPASPHRKAKRRSSAAKTRAAAVVRQEVD